MVVSRFEKLLEESAALHGHLCAGQVIGVRMALLGLSKIGIKDPKGRDRKKVYVIVEIDRCATDAIQSVTGCSLGRRTMRHEDLGIMAATFINLPDHRQSGSSPEKKPVSFQKSIFQKNSINTSSSFLPIKSCRIMSYFQFKR